MIFEGIQREGTFGYMFFFFFIRFHIVVVELSILDVHVMKVFSLSSTVLMILQNNFNQLLRETIPCLKYNTDPSYYLTILMFWVLCEEGTVVVKKSVF